MVKNLPANAGDVRDTGLIPGLGSAPGGRHGNRLQYLHLDSPSQGFPGSSASKESTCKARDPGSIPESESSPGEVIGYPLQYSWASQVVQRAKNLPAKWETWVRSLSWEDPLEEGMETHSSILAWRILWTEEPSGLQSMVLQRVGHNWATKHTYIPSPEQLLKK